MFTHQIYAITEVLLQCEMFQQDAYFLMHVGFVKASFVGLLWVWVDE